MKLLEAAGYVCFKSGASLGMFDVIGIGPTDIVLCQVKSNRWPLEAEMDGLREFKAPVCCKKLVHRWLDHARQPLVREL